MPEVDQVARERLQRLLPTAKARMASETSFAALASGVARMQARHMGEENMAGLEVKRGEAGGWVADLVLREVPPGVADVFGTPVHRPFATEEEAEVAAERMLIVALQSHEQAKTAPPPPRVFSFHGLEVPIPEEGFAVMERMAAQDPKARFGSAARAHVEIARVTRTLFGDAGVTRQAVEEMASAPRTGAKDMRYATLITVLCMAAMEGVFRYPTPTAQPPARHG